MVQPGDSDALTRLESGCIPAEPFHDADHLMTRNDRMARKRELSFDDVKIRPTNAAGPDANANLPAAGFGRWDFLPLERGGFNGSAP